MKSRRLHSWDVSAKQAREIQKRLRKLKARPRPFPLKSIRHIAAADLAFRGGTIHAVVAVFTFPALELVEAATASSRMTFPYVPGLLTFREGPCLLKAFKKLRTEPDVIIFDGQGIAHPSRMGVATHMGILLGKSSIGCGKSRLIGTYTEPPKRKGAFSPLYDGREVIGAVVRSRAGVKPLFISTGFKVDLDSAVRIILACCRGHRVPEPIRFVDAGSKKMARPG